MSFQRIKPTKPELDKLKKRKDFLKRGEKLLEIKREQLTNLLNKIKNDYFDLKSKLRPQLLKIYALFKESYEDTGKKKVERIANLNNAILKPNVNIKYIHSMGIDKPEVEIEFPKKHLPSYSFTDTSILIDVLIKKLNETSKSFAKLAKLDSLMYRITNKTKKIQRRIDALDDLIIPKISKQIIIIDEILSDEEREEFIRLKKIKESLELKKKL